MTAKAAADPVRLSELRAQIDAIDESVHRLLMQRAGVIDELIAVKGTARNGAAFRPGREADMMRRLAARHTGHLPITAIEHLWREIISTFTALQAPFDVAVSEGIGAQVAVDTARFAFGFTVPLHVLANSAAVVWRIEEGGDRLGVVFPAETGEAWWLKLRSASIVARLPFLEVADRPAPELALVIAPPLADPVPFEVACFVIEGKAVPDTVPAGVEIVARNATSALVATTLGADALASALPAGLDIRPVGGYAAPLRIAR